MADRNPHGFPIWYELQTLDADAATRFYDEVLDWRVGPRPAGDMDYRMIDAGAGQVGGVLQLTDAMRAGGAAPGWLFYIGVDDVDATAAAVQAQGGQVLMPAWDIAGIGRIAMIADPQGIACYIMRGASEEASTAYDRTGLGKCNWNELATPDQAAAHAFYAAIFGWSYPDRMPMGPQGDYVFVEVGGQTIGATMTQSGDVPAGWQFYFRAADIERAADRVRRAGGTVEQGPMEVPGGERIIVVRDPQGVPFGIVGPGVGAAQA
jgi:predicted enzyme related to lactoylglutathione lyase